MQFPSDQFQKKIPREIAGPGDRGERENTSKYWVFGVWKIFTRQLQIFQFLRWFCTTSTERGKVEYLWDFLIFQSQISFSKIKRGKVGAKNEVGKKMKKNREAKKLNLFRNCPPSIRGIFRNIPRIQIGTPKILKIKTL